jgi:hypothetical protein
MTISNETTRISFAGDGSTRTFSTTPVVFFTSADLVLYSISSTGVVSTLALTTHYTVTRQTAASTTPVIGTVALTACTIASGSALVIARVLDVTQTADLLNNDSSDADVLEAALDRQAMISQQLQTDRDRALVLALSDTDGSGTYQANSNRIADLGDPEDDQDAATKAYGDANWGGAAATAASASATAAAGAATTAAATAIAAHVLEADPHPGYLLETGGTIAGALVVTGALTSYTSGVGITAVSKLHTYESNATTSAANGITVEQGSTGDASLHLLLTGGTRWAMGIDNSDSDSFVVGTSATLGSSRVLRLSTTGQVLIGNGNSPRATGGFGITPTMQVEGVSASGASLALINNQASSLGPELNFAKSRAAAIGDVTVVQSGDSLGFIRWSGADGTDVTSEGAYIQAAVDGTPGSNDMPGRLLFATTADGAASSTERMRIDSAGNVVIGTAQLADAATGGFLYIPGTTSGAPSGTPTTYSGRHPIVFDDTNNRLYVWNGSAWKYAALT